jgi:Gly-Xaa carboxypeptidase
VGASAYGHLALEDAWGTSLEPAPITPTDADAAPFRLLSGTIRAAFNAQNAANESGQGVFVSPGIMSGNTGTMLLNSTVSNAELSNRHALLLELD